MEINPVQHMIMLIICVIPDVYPITNKKGMTYIPRILFVVEMISS